jgi:hypothetical protein
MAVYAGIYGKENIAEYEGCVLRTYEKNGYEDFDWYAVCWDRSKKAVVDVKYDTTRAGGGGSAVIDATDGCYPPCVSVLLEPWQILLRQQI